MARRQARSRTEPSSGPMSLLVVLLSVALTIPMGVQAGLTGGDGAGVEQPITPPGPVATQEILPDEIGENERFGHVLTMDGGVAVVTATGRAHTPGSGPPVFVYERHLGQLDLVEALDRPDDAHGFGIGVGTDGTTLAVAAPFEDTSEHNAGAVYVYAREDSGWDRFARLVDPDPNHRGQFGWGSVDVHDDTIVVGATGADEAHVFERADQRVGYDHVATLDAPEDRRGSWFGVDVELEQGTLLVGNARRNPDIPMPGSVEVYEREGDAWQHVQRLDPPGEPGGDDVGFGVDLELDGDRLIVGNFRGESDGAESGTAHVYHHDGDAWQLEATLEPPTAGEVDYFGWTVELRGGTAIVPAPLDDNLHGRDAGAAHVYHRVEDAWVYGGELVPQEHRAGDAFGVVAGDDAMVIVGAAWADRSGERSGAVYTFPRAAVDALPGPLG